MKTKRVAASSVKVGDIILPPKGERVWLKSTMTVLGIEAATRQPYGMKEGDWLKITASFVSPYREEGSTELSQMKFFIRPSSMASVVCVEVAS